MIKDFLKDNSTELMAGAAIFGGAITAYLAAKAMPEVLRRLDDEDYNRTTIDGQSGEPIKPMEAISLTWDLFIPAGMSFIVTSGLILGINTIHGRRLASVTAAYGFVTDAYSKYRHAVSEQLGEKGEYKIQEKVVEDYLISHPIEEASVFYTGHGDHLMFDEMTARYFRSDINAVKRAVNDFNKELLDDMYKPLNDFYYELGLQSAALGTDMGYDANEQLLEIAFIPKISQDQQPCIVLHYNTMPRKL